MQTYVLLDTSVQLVRLSPRNVPSELWDYRHNSLRSHNARYAMLANTAMCLADTMILETAARAITVRMAQRALRRSSALLEGTVRSEAQHRCSVREERSVIIHFCGVKISVLIVLLAHIVWKMALQHRVAFVARDIIAQKDLKLTMLLIAQLEGIAPQVFVCF